MNFMCSKWWLTTCWLFQDSEIFLRTFHRSCYLQCFLNNREVLWWARQIFSIKKEHNFKRSQSEQVSYNLGFSFNSIHSTSISTQAPLRGDLLTSWQATTKWSLEQLRYKKQRSCGMHWAQAAGFGRKGCWAPCVKGGHALPCTGPSQS